jgi:peptide/nickel transport system ATP-binding protein
MIFQDPLTSLNPLFTVKQQLVETIQAHLGLSDAEAEQARGGPDRPVGIPEPGAHGRTSIRTSSPAACGSAW